MKLPLSDLFICGVIINVVQAPKFVGVPLGLAQMVLYCFYRNQKGPRVEDAKPVDGGKSLKEKCEENKRKLRSDEQDIEMQLEV